MGTLRFLLAVFVLLSHAGLRVQGLNPGVVAVFVFYAISGYVMAALIQRHYAAPAKTLHFYGDRLLRIYPQYAFYALGAAAWLFTFGHPTSFLAPDPSALEWANNLLIVPLNYFMYNGADRFTLVPPAWSLGAELAFYVLAPWLWRKWPWALALGAISVGVAVLAWHDVLQSDWWGYRLLPGVLWVFLLGMALHRYQQSHPTASHRAVFCLPLLAIGAAWYLNYRGHLALPYIRETLVGAGLGVPLVYGLSKHGFAHGRLQSVDAALGDASYGIFLNHFLFIWCLDLGAPQAWHDWALLLTASVAASVLTQRWLERPVLRWRRYLRL